MTRNKQSAFTLVEVLVIAPMLILLVGAMLTTIATFTGESLRSARKNELIYQVQDTLATIEANSAYSISDISISVSTGTVTAPQGVNNGTGGFVTNQNAPYSIFVLKTPSTNLSTYTYGRSIIYGTSSASPNCTTTTTPYPVYYVYFVTNGTLYERTILGDSAVNTVCGGNTPYQRNSCASGQTAARCVKEDEVLATNVKTFEVDYILNGVQITLELEENVAGEPQSYKSKIFLYRDKY